MEIFDDRRTIDLFVEHFETDIEHIGEGDEYPMQLLLSPDSQVSITVDKVYLPKVGGDKKTGFVFGSSCKSSHPNYSQKRVLIKPESDLDFLIKSQALPILKAHDLSYPEVPVYDSRTLITYDKGHHGVNFAWVETMAGIMVPNEYNLTAGKVLFDQVEFMSRWLDIDMALAMGERGRLFAGVYMDRIGVPLTCSRPVGQKMLKDVDVFSGISGYAAESGEISDTVELEKKGHMISRLFLEDVAGKRVLALDDLDATRHTLYCPLTAIGAHGGTPVILTIIGLEYVYTNPKLLEKGLIADIDVPVYNIFVEHEPLKPVFTPEIKQAYTSLNP